MYTFEEYTQTYNRVGLVFNVRYDSIKKTFIDVSVINIIGVSKKCYYLHLLNILL